MINEFDKKYIPEETLEEAAEREYPTIHEQYQYDAFIDGAKWMQERMYSEDEVIEIVEKSRLTGLTAQYLMLTEQFKKK